MGPIRESRRGRASSKSPDNLNGGRGGAAASKRARRVWAPVRLSLIVFCFTCTIYLGYEWKVFLFWLMTIFYWTEMAHIRQNPIFGWFRPILHCSSLILAAMYLPKYGYLNKTGLFGWKSTLADLIQPILFDRYISIAHYQTIPFPFSNIDFLLDPKKCLKLGVGFGRLRPFVAHKRRIPSSTHDALVLFTVSIWSLKTS